MTDCSAISTIFQFVGELREENGGKKPGLSLLKTRYLPSLEGKTWDGETNSALTDAQRRIIKRSKLTINIIKSDSSETSKYELFQRLNTGGTIATDQEVRNCLMIMNDREMFAWLENLAKDDQFSTCAFLTSRQLDERYDMELILRFMIFKELTAEQLRFDDLGEFLTEKMLAIATGRCTLWTESYLDSPSERRLTP